MKVLTTTGSEQENRHAMILIPEASDTVAALRQELTAVSQAQFLVLFIPAASRLFWQNAAFEALEDFRRQHAIPICFVLAGPELEPIVTKKHFAAIVPSEEPVTAKDVLQALQSQQHTPTLPQQKNESPTPPLFAQRGQSTRSRQKRLWGLAALALFVLSSLVGMTVLLHPSQPQSPTSTPVAGYVSFSNSEQISENSAQGIADQVTVDISAIPAPTREKSYYAWLLPDKDQNDPQAVLLGKLSVSNGKAHLFYGGDSQHTNLLGKLSRFLVTEEDSAVQPLAPSPDQSAWCLSGEFPDTPLPAPTGQPRFSYLDHLRHLLASDPTLDQLGLPGGLNNWFYRNTGKVFERTGSLRESWEETRDTAFLRRQLQRTLEFLDGVTLLSQDLPPSTPLLVNERLARIGLIQVNGPSQEPPSYMSHIVHHLSGLLQAGGATTNLSKKIAPLLTALANVEQYLGKVHIDARQLLKMTDDDLKRNPQTLTLINDMIDNATHAYTGTIDPNTHELRQGATWIHQQMQILATIDVAAIHA